ncbi:MAG: D-ribose pyranase [Lacisediminihabitans sp.]
MRSNGGTLNAQLSRVISESGHTDSIVVADAGLPIPASVERIDLAYRAGAPAFLDVLDTVLAEFVVEKAIVSSEMVDASPDMLNAIRQRLEPLGVEVKFTPHSEFKQRTHHARAVVRSGEFTPYSNVILYAGVPF